MTFRIALFAIPTIAVVGVVLLLNAVDASAGIAVAALGLVAILGGAALGAFADQLPEFPQARRRRPQDAAGLAGAHDARH
jgi:hypothetical protein